LQKKITILEIIWGLMILGPHSSFTAQSDGAQLTLGTDVVDLRGGSPHPIVSWYASVTSA
jgi:hypothetical protein